jgi:hypothetical protein
MRPLVELTSRAGKLLFRFALASVACALVALPVSAEPKPADGYQVELVRKPGAAFAGLARDGDAMLLTDLASGRLYRLGADDKFTLFGPALPHGRDVIGDPTGPYRIARQGSTYLVTQGWTPVDGEVSPYDHALLEVDDTSVVRVIRNDLLNPFDFVADGDAIYLIDAAQNSIERLTDQGRRKTTLFSFVRLGQPANALKNLSPTEFASGDNYEVDAVPTGLAAQGNRLYVSLFGGFPFIAGSGRVVSLGTADGIPSMRIDAVDLNAPVGLAFATGGRMLVLEHGLYDPTSGFRAGSGRLLSIDITSGEREVLLDGLTRPAAVLVLDARRTIVSGLDGTIVFLRRSGN